MTTASIQLQFIQLLARLEILRRTRAGSRRPATIATTGAVPELPERSDQAFTMHQMMLGE
jgi:hypothetical protein